MRYTAITNYYKPRSTFSLDYYTDSNTTLYLSSSQHRSYSLCIYRRYGRTATSTGTQRNNKFLKSKTYLIIY